MERRIWSGIIKTNGGGGGGVRGVCKCVCVFSHVHVHMFVREEERARGHERQRSEKREREPHQQRQGCVPPSPPAVGSQWPDICLIIACTSLHAVHCLQPFCLCTPSPRPAEIAAQPQCLNTERVVAWRKCFVLKNLP